MIKGAKYVYLRICLDLLDYKLKKSKQNKKKIKVLSELKQSVENNVFKNNFKWSDGVVYIHGRID